MTKEITKAIILQEMQDKLKLREFEPADFLFDETVVPVYNIEQHLGKWEVMAKTVSITSAAAFTFFEVPHNERWTLRSYFFVFLMTGAIKASGLFVNRRPPPDHFIYLDLLKGQEVSYLVNLPQLVILNPGNTLECLIDTYVSTQDLRLYIDVRKDEIR